jgi:hypothetical protein
MRSLQPTVSDGENATQGGHNLWRFPRFSAQGLSRSEKPTHFQSPGPKFYGFPIQDFQVRYSDNTTAWYQAGQATATLATLATLAMLVALNEHRFRVAGC